MRSFVLVRQFLFSSSLFFFVPLAPPLAGPFFCKKLSFMLSFFKQIYKFRTQPTWLNSRQKPHTKMAVPRHHMAKGKQKRRRSHLALKPTILFQCSHCKKMIIPHVVCKFCGYYKGKEVVNVLAKELKKKEKQQHKTK